jgi:hypothetical protein
MQRGTRGLHLWLPMRHGAAPWAGPRARGAARLQSLSTGVGRGKERGTGDTDERVLPISETKEEESW